MKILTISPWNSREIAEASDAVRARDAAADLIHAEFGQLVWDGVQRAMHEATVGCCGAYRYFYERDFVMRRLAALREGGK